MIIIHVSDPPLRTALRRAAHVEEDVIDDVGLAAEALLLGYPRLLVTTPADMDRLPLVGPACSVPILEIQTATLARWDAERRAHSVPPARVEFLVDRVGGLLEKQSRDATWVDRTLGDLSRAAGSGLPPALRGFARRVLEFPSHYADLHTMAETCGLSRGALKARFRRRGLPSPYAYIRWLRVLACAHLLSDRGIPVAGAARRLGFTSAGNLCRTMISLTAVTPTEARTLRGWNRLLLCFAWEYLGPDELAAWRDLDELFIRRAA
jgi:AraC-like DNA-binding protein